MKIYPLLPNSSKVAFKSAEFLEFNSDYNSLKYDLERELNKFLIERAPVQKIGEGVCGVTYRFLSPKLENVVLKKNKPSFKDDYAQEYKNLLMVPKSIGGQRAIARAYDSVRGQYFLVSSFVQGKSIAHNRKIPVEHLRLLFDKMYELDKEGIYHGDLNGKNILYSPDGKINFIDYQWAQKVSKTNFYDGEKTRQILMPVTNFPENAQMFEMSTLPWYFETLGYETDKRKFMVDYLKVKSDYHQKRYNYIKEITRNWPYSSELGYIRKSLEYEKAKADVYKRPTSEVLAIEFKKMQFFSDYRNAYSHVDSNLPDRNIIASSSAYLCSLSSVQDFRKAVEKNIGLCSDYSMKKYLESMQEFGTYWYDALSHYTSDTFDYVMRATTKKMYTGEPRHNFYQYGRNPRDFKANRDIVSNMSYPTRAMYEKNFDIPVARCVDLENIYSQSVVNLQNILFDKDSVNNTYKIRTFTKQLNRFRSKSEGLNLLNVSQLATLKIKEFESHIKHNTNTTVAKNMVDKLFLSTVDFTQTLFKSVYKSVSEESARKIVVKGYENMRKFKTRL